MSFATGPSGKPERYLHTNQLENGSIDRRRESVLIHAGMGVFGARFDLSSYAERSLITTANRDCHAPIRHKTCRSVIFLVDIDSRWNEVLIEGARSRYRDVVMGYGMPYMIEASRAIRRGELCETEKCLSSMKILP